MTKKSNVDYVVLMCQEYIIEGNSAFSHANSLASSMDCHQL